MAKLEYDPSKAAQFGIDVIDRQMPAASKPEGSKKKSKGFKMAGPDAGMLDAADLFGVAKPMAGEAGGWLDDDDDDDDFWGGSAVDVSEADLEGSLSGQLRSYAKDGEALGALGVEAEQVAASRKTTHEMESLTRAAHERKAAQEAKAAEVAAKKAEQAAKADLALEAKRSSLDGRREEVAAAVTSGCEAARVRLDAERAAGELDGTLEANATVQEEESMVMEAVMGEEAFARVEGAVLPSFDLSVTGEGSDGGERTVQLRVSLVAEYPSHLPPSLEVLSGVEPEDVRFVHDSLLALFYAHRDESRAADEPAEGVAHKWVEWMRDEWMAAH